MAHSIMAAKDEEQAAKAALHVYIPDAIHSLVWSDPTGRTLPAPRGRDVGRFPFLSRLADPYRDATIHAAEVAGFRQEVLRVLEALTPASAARSVMEQIAALSKAAESSGWPLFCHGD